jgi:hypothetical protein
MWGLPNLLGDFRSGRVESRPIALVEQIVFRLMKTVEMNKHIGLDEKLNILQEADSIRPWSSLDDRRLCVLCNRVITGRMIDIWQDAHGSYHFHCPTPGCPAEPRDWFYHGPMTIGAAAGRSFAKYRRAQLQGVS